VWVTPLHIACYHGHPAIVLRLLRAGADTKLRSEDGNSALQIAKERGHFACVEAFRQHITEVTASRREAAGGAGGASSGEAAAAAAGASASSLGGLPEEARQATVRGDEAALLAWLDSGGRVNATCGLGNVSGISP
jgi:ankyrin repeat protein